jgi:hypothetical protein
MGKKRVACARSRRALRLVRRESLDYVDGDGSHASYRVGLEGGDRR